MATWITDRTQADVDRVNELHDKANVGTWTEEERIEWAAGMKGSLSYMDYNRIESGVSELAATLGASVSIKTNWTVEGYMTTSDANRWLSNVSNIRAKCSGPGGLPSTPTSMDKLAYKTMNEIEEILAKIERIANDHLLYCDEPICGGEPYYGIC
jgi:hypothetical protein